MPKRKFRNLFRERIDHDARERAAAGLAPLTHADWTLRFNRSKHRAGAPAVKQGSIPRWASNSPKVAQRVGMDRVWILRELGVDVGAYLEAWGGGPEGS